MAVKYFCDRCDRNVTTELQLTKLSLPRLNEKILDVWLCSWCMGALVNWVKSDMSDVKVRNRETRSS